MTRAFQAMTVVAGAVLALTAAHAAQACGPSHRAIVAGPVLDAPEAGVICVALGPRPDQWVRVRLAGGERLDRRRLMAAAFSKRVECVLGEAGGWSCRLPAGDLAALAASPEVGLIAAAWR